jgi:two-component system chemotaxis response regulator CheB
MHEARVLVVDDSAAMRALFSDILDDVRDVRVVGTAASAAEAREKIDTLKPNVLTLDVEMPGMSGIEFLEEIMESRPMPVVMLSGLTQSGTEVSLKAYELGAVECFPKPLKATPDQFAKTVGKLGKIVLAAANSNLRSKPRAKATTDAAPFKWNGHVAAFSASMGGIDALSILLANWPANCPPTVICLQAEQPLIETFIARLDADCKCSVRALKDGAQLVQGVVHVTADQGSHVVFEAGTPPRLRLLAREPIDGVRPSANLLFGTLARTGTPAAAAVLSGLGEDGAKGLKMMRDAGADTFVQDPATALVPEAPAASFAAGGAKSQLLLDDLGVALLAACSQS